MSDKTNTPVDVLAVMDLDAGHARASRECHYPADLVKAASAKSEEARAAVAELIDAAEKTCSTWPQTARVCGLRAALARCKGGAA